MNVSIHCGQEALPRRRQEHVEPREGEEHEQLGAVGGRKVALGGTTCVKATCLIRPHLFYALFAVSKIIMICYILRRF